MGVVRTDWVSNLDSERRRNTAISPDRWFHTGNIEQLKGLYVPLNLHNSLKELIALLH